MPELKSPFLNGGNVLSTTEADRTPPSSSALETPFLRELAFPTDAAFAPTDEAESSAGEVQFEEPELLQDEQPWDFESDAVPEFADEDGEAEDNDEIDQTYQQWSPTGDNSHEAIPEREEVEHELYQTEEVDRTDREVDQTEQDADRTGLAAGETEPEVEHEKGYRSALKATDTQREQMQPYLPTNRHGYSEEEQRHAVSNPRGLVASTRKLAPISVGVYAINRYKRCGQKPLDFCKALAGGFAGAMKSRGHHVAVARNEQDVSPLQWSFATDEKRNGVDTVDFAYLASHGSTYGTELPGSRWLHWFLATCDSPDGCLISTILLVLRTWHPPDAKNPVTTMRLGERRLRWVVFDCCRSQHIRDVNERDMNAKAQLAETTPGQTWGRCYDGVHMLFGFTGLSSDASWTSKRGASFGLRVGRGEAMAESWIDEAYSHWVDDAPVVTAFGQSPKEVDQRLRSESLKNPGSAPTRPISGYVYSTMWRS